MTKIVLDAGHGGLDPGAVYEGRQEKDDNLELVFDVGAVLENNGIDVEYTRVTDVYQSPYEKAAMANQSGADYFVSIHRNARDVPNTEGGVETLLYSTEDSRKKDMAEAINRNLEEIGFVNRGIIARPNLVVLRDTDMPALLVEAGFIDSEADNALYDANRAAIADAIAYGILAGLSETADDPAAEEPGTGDRRRLAEEETNEIGSAEEYGTNGTAYGNSTVVENHRGGLGDAEQKPEENQYDKTFHIQIGVYRNPSNARIMLNRLQNRGYQAYMLYRNGLYYVQTGAYPDLPSAVAADRALKRAGFQTLIVTE